MSSPPPPYSIKPPPAYVRPLPRRKSAPVSRRATARPSSREMLTRALYLAQHAVELDSSESESDMPAAIAAYDEAIALLQRVIAQRSQNPSCVNEVVRVTEIHNRYSDRVRELCQARRIPLPHHVVPAPAPASASALHPTPPEFSPQATSSSSPPLPRQDTSAVAPPPTNGVSLEPLQLRRFRTSRTLPTHTDDEPDWVPPELSPSSSTSSTFEYSLLLISPPTATASTTATTTDADRETVEEEGDDSPDRGRQWIWAAARDEELKEWGQYLEEEECENCRLSVATAASSAVWSTIATTSHGECVRPSSTRKFSLP